MIQAVLDAILPGDWPLYASGAMRSEFIFTVVLYIIKSKDHALAYLCLCSSAMPSNDFDGLMRKWLMACP